MSTLGRHAPARFAGLTLDDGVARVVVLEAGATTTTPGADESARGTSTGGLLVIDAAEADLPVGVVVDGRVQDNAALGQRLGQLWRELRLGGVPTFVGLQPADAWVQVLTLADWTLANWPETGVPAEVARSVDAMRQSYREDPVWSVAAIERPLGSEADLGREAMVRVVGCRREDLSAAAWAARRSGIWVSGIKLTVTSLPAVLHRPRTGGLLWIDNSSAGSAILALVGGEGAPGVCAVGRFGGPLPALAGSVGVAAVDDAALADWNAALDSRSGQDRVAGAVAALVGRARFEPLCLAGTLEVLDPDSPRPVDQCVAALGLALAAAGVGPVTDDLQRPLLHGGAGVVLGRPQPSAPRQQAETNGQGTGGDIRTATGTLTQVTHLTIPAVSRAKSLLPPPRAHGGVERSVGLLHGPALARSHGRGRDQAGTARMSTVVDAASMPFDSSSPFHVRTLGTMSHHPASVWVHRAGLGHGQPHVGVLDGDQLELRGAVSTAIRAQSVRRAAVRCFGADAVTGDLCIHPDADPDGADGVRWERRFSFAPGAAAVSVDQRDTLDELLGLLEDYPWASVVIEGHTDVAGDLGGNLRLSRARADSVAEVLVAEGCDVARIAVRGRGPFAPLSEGDTALIRALHRRVDVTFLGLLA